MKKIAFLMYCMGYGGTEKVLVNLLNNLDYTKYEVTLWLCSDNNPLLDEVDSRVIIRRWDIESENNGKDIKTIIRYYFQRKKSLTAINKIVYRALASAYRHNDRYNSYYFEKSLPPVTEEKYDCVVAYGGVFLGLVTTAFTRFNAEKYIAWIHGDHWDNAPFFKKLYRKASKIFCVSEETKEKFIHKYSQLADVTEVFYNIVDTKTIRELSTEYEVRGRHPMICTVGRVSEIKGQLLIPEIALKLKSMGIEFSWFIVGDGPTRTQLMQDIHNNSLEESVICVGAKANPYPYMSACDIYVQPSYSEGYCTSTTEAKVLKKTIVVTDVPGMREQFVENENAIFAKETTSESIYQALYLLLNNHDLCEKLQNNLCEQEGNLREIKKFDKLLE